MRIPPTLKPMLWGAVAGAITLAVGGFSWGGWVTGSKAESMANEKASIAVVEALAPICVDNFRRDPQAQAQRLALEKVSTWEREDFMAKGGWAMIPGMKSVNMAMARACAEVIVSDKS